MRHIFLNMLGVLVFACVLVSGPAAAEEKATEADKAAVAEEKKETAADKKEAAAEKKEGAEAAKGEKEPPETLVFEKAKLGKVTFPHKAHAEANGGCAACHEGKEPLFKQERTKDVYRMKDHESKACGTCHDGKRLDKNGKPVFAVKGGCMKCHKKQ